MNQTAGILRTGRKFNDVILGGRTVFMRDGFEGASVDDIAREAGVSKATLYSYFPDKRALFIEVLTQECTRMATQTEASIDDCAPAHEVLTSAAGYLVRFLLSPFAQRIFRVCIAEADRFPELGQAFYQSGPRMGRERLREYFDKAIAAGELAIDDTALAAEQFSELCKAGLWTKAAFGLQTAFTDAEIDRVVQGAVDTFLARYGTDPSRR